MGGKDPHSSALQIAADVKLSRVEKAASMYLRGTTYNEIALHFGVTYRTAREYVTKARKLWRRRAEQTYGKHLNEQLARLDEIECAAWIGWQRSLRDELTTGTEEGFRSGEPVDVTKISRRSQSGNASFLKVIMDVVRQRSELLGLMDEETRNAANDSSAQVVSVVVESREEAKEFKSLKFTEFRDQLKDEGDTADDPPKVEAS